jgi:hypothetical protein
MRIACLHIPQFALQCVTRTDPSLRGAAVVVVGAATDPKRSDSKLGRLASISGSGSGSVSGSVSVSGGPIVQACSRAAWALGARVGMTGTAVRAIDPSGAQLKVISADAQLERETIRAIADVVLGISGVVDVGGRIGAGAAHLAMYCEVPSKTRGASFGDRLIEKLEALGLTGRIGIADDRFTAWVAASSPIANRRGEDEDAGVVSVPRGGSAAFLAPRPLSLLAISPEVQHMLEALGVNTLGQFAALPAPSVTRPLEADYQALARGEAGNTLRPYAPDAPIREEVAIGEAATSVSMPAAVALLAERIALRLAGRGRGAARLDLVIGGEGGERIVPIAPLTAKRSLELAITPALPANTVLSTAEQLAEAIGVAMRDEERTAWRLRVVVTGEALAGDEPSMPSAESLDEAPAIVDTLSVVLSNTGGSLDLAFGPGFTMPLGPRPTAGVLRDERREAHRRTRRKQRRRVAVSPSLVQPRLFKNLP